MTWISSIASQIMDAVSGLFLNALGTDMVTMEEYFPFITKAFDVMQYTAWAVLFLIVVWQLFRAFGGPITEAENPWQLVVRGAIFALLIGYAKPIFMLALDIARAPYTALMDVSMTAEEFTFAGVEQVLSNGLLTIVSTVTVVGPMENPTTLLESYNHLAADISAVVEEGYDAALAKVEQIIEDCSR